MKDNTVYTPEEIQEIKAWYRDRMDQLPTSFELHVSFKTKNLKKVITSYMEMVDMHSENPTYTPQIRHLFLIRDKLIKDGLVS